MTLLKNCWVEQQSLRKDTKGLNWMTDKRKRIKVKQWSTKHYKKTQDWAKRTPQKSGGELKCSGRVPVSSSCSISGTCHVILVEDL
jgi:hypothetical protein